MPSKLVNEIVVELKSVHEKLDIHLNEGVGVKSDIAWLKKITFAVLVAIMSLWFKH